MVMTPDLSPRRLPGGARAGLEPCLGSQITDSPRPACSKQRKASQPRVATTFPYQARCSEGAAPTVRS